jgi:hypothetical protein
MVSTAEDGTTTMEPRSLIADPKLFRGDLHAERRRAEFLVQMRS